MNVIEMDRALRSLRLSGMSDVLEARLLQAQTERWVPLDTVAALVRDELTRRQDRLLKRRIVPGRVEPLVRELEERIKGQDDYFAALRANLVFGPKDHELSWKAPERRGRLADAVAALFKKAMTGHEDAQLVWEQLANGYRRSDAALPSCVGLDLTGRVEELCRRPWPSRRAR